MPEKSTLPSGVRGAGAVRFGFPSAVRGTPGVGYGGHCAKTDEPDATQTAIAIALIDHFIHNPPDLRVRDGVRSIDRSHGFEKSTGKARSPPNDHLMHHSPQN